MSKRTQYSFDVSSHKESKAIAIVPWLYGLSMEAFTKHHLKGIVGESQHDNLKSSCHFKGELIKRGSLVPFKEHGDTGG